MEVELDGPPSEHIVDCFCGGEVDLSRGPATVGDANHAARDTRSAVEQIKVGAALEVVSEAERELAAAQGVRVVLERGT